MSRSKRISLTPKLLSDIENIITKEITDLRLFLLRNGGNTARDNELIDLNKTLTFKTISNLKGKKK